MADNAENVDTSTIGNVNSVRADLTQQEYLFKLVPDFGVFDIAEKYFIDNNKINTVEKLFFYGTSIGSDKSKIDFRRFIIKSIGNPGIIPENKEPSDYFKKSYTIGEYTYTIIIDECLKSGGFIVSSSTNSNVIGVCF